MTKESNPDFWSKKYQEENIGWNIGYASPPISEYLDQLTNKKQKILIPGAGNAYEAEYAFRNGFESTFVLDFAKEPLENLKKRLPNFPKEQCLHEDFFKHNGQYDLIIEQTFFCALSPTMRSKYVKHMHSLLKTKSKLIGLLFDMDKNDGPPYGGSFAEYKNLFTPYFSIKQIEKCHNSISPRQGNELFVIFEKK